MTPLATSPSGYLLVLTTACYCFGRSMELPGVTPADYLALYPVITVLASVPLTPGALGIREGLFVTLLAPLGVESHLAVGLSLLVYGGAIVWSLFGGVLFLVDAGAGWRAELREMKQEE